MTFGIWASVLDQETFVTKNRVYDIVQSLPRKPKNLQICDATSFHFQLSALTGTAGEIKLSGNRTGHTFYKIVK